MTLVWVIASATSAAVSLKEGRYWALLVTRARLLAAGLYPLPLVPLCVCSAARTTGLGVVAWALKTGVHQWRYSGRMPRTTS